MRKHLLLFGVVLIAFTFTSNTSKKNQVDEKVTVCHIPRGNPGNSHPIEISVNALQAHLAHGDFIGDCSEPN